MNQYEKPTFLVKDANAVNEMRLVKLNTDGTVQHAGVGEASIGFANNTVPLDSASSNAPAQNRGRTTSITPWGESPVFAVAAGAITVGAEVTGAAAGKVQAGQGTGYVNVSPGVTSDGDVCMLVKKNNGPNIVSATSAQLGDDTADINDFDKYAGKPVFDSTNGYWVYAAGSNDTDVWKKFSDNTTAYTPTH